MKILFSLCCAFLLLTGRPGWAQELQSTPSEESNRPNKLEGLYLNLGIGTTLSPSGSTGLSGAVTALLQKGWGVSFGVHYVNLTTRNVPVDYVAGTPLFGSPGPSNDLLHSFSLTAVRKYYAGQGRLARWGWEAGPALVRYEEVEFTRIPAGTSTGWFSSGGNYHEAWVPRNTLGLQLGLSATVLPGRGFGLEANLWGNLNAARSVIGIEARLLLGKVRSKNTSY